MFFKATTKPENIPFTEFVSRIECYESLKKISERNQTICGVTIDDLTWLPYQLLKHEIPDFLKQYEFERVIFEIIRLKDDQVEYADVVATDNYDKLKFFFWIEDQYQKINDLEVQYLSSPPDSKLAAAGIKDLDILGDINLIDSLAQGDILRWEQVRRLPYSQIFDKQLKITIEARIQKRLTKQAKQKHS